MQCHHPIALAGVLYGSLFGGLDPELFSAAVEARGPMKGLSPDLNTLSFVDEHVRPKTWNTYNT